jgi:parvulin-like peptidyl-prolyl isomerase
MNPDDFGNLAKTWSEDAPSACVKGLIQPIRRNGPCPEVEQVVFAMADGQVSGVIPSAGQYVIVKREGLIGGNTVPLERVQPRLEKIITEKKLRGVAGGLFKQLQANAKVQNVYNDEQLKMQFGPGVVALINGAPIYLRQLDEECMARHGVEILDSLVNRRIVELACRAQNVVVTDQDIEAEMAHSASEMMKPLPDGKPDVKKWLEVVSHNQNVSPAVYRNTIIWPTVALRKLAAGKVEVTNEDIQKGLEANYGKRVRCRAIVLNNDRKAQEVWEKARQSMTGNLATNAQRFGELAAKYSIEGSSRALEGEVPPIARNHGQPMLEEEAFKLKPGELSGVIHLEASKSVILFCEGFTEPVQVDFAMIRDELIADIREKKQRLAMSDYFDHLQASAAISNVLDPSASHSPRKTAAAGPASSVVPVSYIPADAAPAGGK